MRTSRLAGVVVVAVTGLAGLQAAPAVAAPQWVDGLREDHYTQTCGSLAGVGGYREELSSSVLAGMLVDPQDVPEVGEVFYGRVLMAAVGGCQDKAFAPEVLPPAGVEVAISAANPVRCSFTLLDGPPQPLAGCPQTLRPGPHGGLSLAPGGDPASVWSGVGRIPGTPDLSRPQLEIVHIEFPLRATRPLLPLPGGPSCPQRTARTGPCPVAVAGDFLQVAVTVFDVGIPVLTPAVGLVAVPGAAAPVTGTPGTSPPAGAPAGGPAPVPGGAPGTGAPAATPARSLVTVARSVRLSSAVRGLPVRVAVPANGTRVSATLSARSFGRIATVTRRDVRAGTLRLRMTPTRRVARRLRRVRPRTATLRVTVRAPGRAATVEAITVRLRR